MEILSPKVIKFQPNTIILTHTGSFEYTDPVFNVLMTKSITTLTFSKMGVNLPSVEFGMTSPKDKRVKLFAGMQHLIKSCVDNAEEIKNTIHRIVISNSKPKNEEERIELMKMDFVKLKKWFMDDIRESKIYKDFSEYNALKKLKSYSIAFNTFILDRNKYTHGQLCFLYPSYDFILEYIETPAQQKRYASIDTNILTSYNNCYIEIKKLINEYEVVHQTKQIDDYKKKQN